MLVTETSDKLFFLSGGGEMGEITRSVDWASTPLGPIDKWSYSLRATLGIVLHSAFPKFLFWGPSHTCFYNDAYRPSLGTEGKHPAVGKPGIEVWTDIWEFIGPLIEGVMTTAKPVWFEDQLVPFYRNGKVEEIYWTFCYSPAYDDDGRVAGVIVTCTETTEKVNILRKLTQSSEELSFAIDAAELATFDYNPKTHKFQANDRLKKWFGLLPENEIDLQKAIDVIAERDKDRVSKAIQGSLVFESGGKYEATYTIVHPQTGVERIVNAKGKAYFDENNQAYRLNGTLQDVTKDILSRTELEDEKRRRELAMDAGGFGVFEVDLKTDVIIADKRFNTLFGFDKTQERDAYVANCHPDDLLIRQQALRAGLENGSFDYETRFYHSDGSLHWIRSRGNVVYDDNHRPSNMYGVSQDVTAQKLVSKRLEDSALQMRGMIESMPFPIGVYIGEEMRIQYANQFIIDIFGKGKDVIGKSYKKILPELDNQEVFKQLDSVFTTGKAIHIENQRIDLVSDGKLRTYYFNYSFNPLFDSDGKVYGVMNTAVDLTVLQLAQQAIQKSEANLRNTILQAPVAMCILRGPKHVVELANERMFELWGRPSHELSGKPLFEGLPEVSGQGFEELLRGVYTTGKTFSALGAPVSLPRDGGIENLFVNFVYEAYREPDGVISGILVVAVDVTPQVIAHKKIEEVVAERTKELADANKGLHKSNAELAQFAYIASHDLQEPLRKISTFTQMLEDRIEGKIDAQSKNYLGKISNASERMTTLIRDVLAYSELDRQSELFAEVDLNVILKNTITDYELLIEQRQGKIESDVLPIIQAIPLQMSQLFSNLIANALKFIRKGVAPVIKITAANTIPSELENTGLDSSMQYITIRFEDNGIGFEEGHADRIFSIFQRLHRKSEYEGTGIGLALCKKIAINHHGDLTAKGSSATGAVFNFIVPRTINEL